MSAKLEVRLGRRIKLEVSSLEEASIRMVQFATFDYDRHSLTPWGKLYKNGQLFAKIGPNGNIMKGRKAIFRLPLDVAKDAKSVSQLKDWMACKI